MLGKLSLLRQQISPSPPRKFPNHWFPVLLQPFIFGVWRSDLQHRDGRARLGFHTCALNSAPDSGTKFFRVHTFNSSNPEDSSSLRNCARVQSREEKDVIIRKWLPMKSSKRLSLSDTWRGALLALLLRDGLGMHRLRPWRSSWAQEYSWLLYSHVSCSRSGCRVNTKATRQQYSIV